MEAARRAHRYDLVAQRYAMRIAERPDEPDRYAERTCCERRILDLKQALADMLHRARKGKAAVDLRDARLLNPQIDADYARSRIKP